VPVSKSAANRRKTVTCYWESDLPNFIVTPHIAWASREAMRILADLDCNSKLAQNGDVAVSAT
jgi:lactate dehydrogenase-like 2-hydroxyacid dehydrogenase